MDTDKITENARAEWSKTRQWRHDRWVEITDHKAASACCVVAGVVLTGLVRLTIWVL